MTQRPKVSFIICTYNRADYLDDTLYSLQDQHLVDLQVELLIVDNNSTDETPRVVHRHQESYSKDHNPIRYIKEPNQGLSHARNRGIKEAKAPFLVFLDDDIRATGSLISAWYSFVSEHPQAMAAGGKIHVQFDASRPRWMSHFLLPLLGHHDLGNSLRKYPAGKYPFGGNMGFRKALFNRVSPFNTNLGRKGRQLKASEEKELFERIRDKDITVYYLPEAMLYHRVDEQRLTEEYIKRQALGLGQSMALQAQSSRMTYWMRELPKWGASLLLFFPYALSLQPAKAVMLLKFRKWIAEGYFSGQS
ncbi:glycosyltransferase [Fodinibius sediminis]|nr:glycosyltransferase [Fodinibius sediminis]